MSEEMDTIPVSDPRYSAAVRAIEAMYAYRALDHKYAVKWIEDSAGHLIVFTRGEYKDSIRLAISENLLPEQKFEQHQLEPAAPTLDAVQTQIAADRMFDAEPTPVSGDLLAMLDAAVCDKTNEYVNLSLSVSQHAHLKTEVARLTAAVEAVDEFKSREFAECRSIDEVMPDLEAALAAQRSRVAES